MKEQYQNKKKIKKNKGGIKKMKGAKRKLVILNKVDNSEDRKLLKAGKIYKGTTVHCYGGDDDDWLDDTVLVED